MAIKRFDPEKIAAYEADGWRAYYERNWLKLLQLIVLLNQQQFNIPFPLSIIAAYYVTRAAAAWVPVEHDVVIVQAYYEKFYRLARRYSGLSFDPARAAELETRYNDVHRKLVGNPDKTEFVNVMTALHVELFGLTPQQARSSAEFRVLANNTVDLITGKQSTDPAADWRKLTDYLKQCYRSIAVEMDKKAR